MFKNGLTANNEILLVKRIETGDRDAEEALFSRYREKIRIYIYYNIASFPSVKNDPDVIDDIIQEACLGALESFRKGSYNPESGAVSTYMYRIARNKLIDCAGKIMKNPSQPLPDEEAGSAPEETVVVPENHDKKDRERLRTEAVEQCLQTVNAVCRRALYYRYFEELSIPEITQLMDMTPSQVSSRISDGIKSFRKNWKKFIKTHPYSDYFYE